MSDLERKFEKELEKHTLEEKDLKNLSLKGMKDKFPLKLKEMK